MSLDTRVKTWGNFLSNPVMMSLFVVVLKNVDPKSEDRGVSDLPDTKADLYRRAICQLVASRVAATSSSSSNHPALSCDAVMRALSACSLENHMASRRDFRFPDDIDPDAKMTEELAPIDTLLRLTLDDSEDPVHRVPTLKVCVCASMC